MKFKPEFRDLPAAASFLEVPEGAVIALAAENLRVCFLYRGNLAGYAKGQNPQLSRCWFDGYLSSRNPVKLCVETHHTRPKIGAGPKEYRTVADTLSPGAVDVVKNLTQLPDPPALGENEYITRLDDDGNPISTSIPKSDWLFHIDDLRALAVPATSGKTEKEAPETTPAKPMQRQQFQQQEILQAITTLGYSAEALPKQQPGKSGVKAQVRTFLKMGTGIFNKAWDRLRAQGEIKDAP